MDWVQSTGSTGQWSRSYRIVILQYHFFIAYKWDEVTVNFQQFENILHIYYHEIVRFNDNLRI